MVAIDNYDYKYWGRDFMSSTTLKLIALVLMLIDHVAEFIPGIPVWCHWLGRISAPLFMFCMIWGFYYTHDRKKYLIRMYAFGVLMGVIDLTFNNIFQKPYHYITNNVFVTLFIIGVIVWLIEYKQEDKKKGTNLILKFTAYQVVTTIICVLLDKLIPLYNTNLFVGALTGNLIFNEGSFVFVFLGVLMYFNKSSKKSISKAYGIFCLVYFLMTISSGHSIDALFMKNYQWMMIASLPFMLLYNGQKGKGLKYLFYVFYPTHIVLLFLIGNLCF
jgi:hypothetical protein